MLGFAPLGGAPLGAPSASPSGTPGTPAADGVLVTDAAAADINNLNAVVTDGVRVASTLTTRWLARATLLDALKVSDSTYQGAAQLNPVPVSVADGMTLGDALKLDNAKIAIVVEALQFADLAAAIFAPQQVDRLGIGSTLTVGARYNAFVVEGLKLLDRDQVGTPVSVTEGVAFVDQLSAQTSIRIVEGLRIAAQLGSGGAVYHLQLAENLRLVDKLARFLGVTVTDGVAIASILTALKPTPVLAIDGIRLGDAPSPKLVFSAVAADGVSFTDADLVKMIFNPVAVDGVTISGGYLDVTGTFTTWAMNTRTGAVTEYGAAFEFNSFAAVGNHYLGASLGGLYELLGDDDNGVPIVATIAGGYMQFGGTQLSRLKEAYIAARGEGHWVLKVLTGDGDTYVYQVDNRSGRNTKFHMGKGMRARYFAYELTALGQDFDLDTLEFVPLVVQRRV